MKWFITLLGVLLLVTGCTQEGSTDTQNNQKNPQTQSKEDFSSTALKIKPAKLSKREKSLVNQIGADYQTFYTVDGKIKSGEVFVSSIIIFKKGKQKEALSSPVNQTGFSSGLHSFQLQMEKKTTFLTIGAPNGYAKGSTTTPGSLGAFMFKKFDNNEITLKKDAPVYLSYLIGSSKNTVTSQDNEDMTTLPKSVKNAEFAVVFKVELKDSSDL
ncbi:hypothetical protein Q7A53_03795 [Halobacillus rhizosphaerae]|uniref:hypothetical protein n=1 Tax=Halobacillus rhizosphaerae TaxID=3064889 RepID=UPI00398ADB66